MVSYSFHMSAKSHAVATSGKVAQVSRHNLREYTSTDYDRNEIEIIAGSEKSILDDVKKIYHEEFDEYLKKYNQGKRPDRQIGDYFNHVSDSRGDVAAEIIIQVGDCEFWKDKTDKERRQMSYIYRDQLRALEKLVPEFKVASAVIHYDESSPHMHVVGVPVATGYKKGMEKQVAKTKVFTAERLSYLQDRMRENAMRGMELEQNKNLFAGIQLKNKEKGRNKDIPGYYMKEFKEAEQKAAERVKAYEAEAGAKKELAEGFEREAQKTVERARKYASTAKAYKQIADRVHEKHSKLPEMPAVKVEKVVDSPKTLFQQEKTHEEYYAAIPAPTREEAERISKEVVALYTKHFSAEALEEVQKEANAKAEKLLKGAQEKIAEAERIMAQRTEIIAQAYSEARVQAHEAAGKEYESTIDFLSSYEARLKGQIKVLEQKLEGIEEECNKKVLKAEQVLEEALEIKKDPHKRVEYLRKMVGLVPYTQEMKAFQRLEEAQKAVEGYLSQRDLRLISAGKHEELYDSLREKGIPGNRDWELCKALKCYEEAKNAPHTLEEATKLVDEFIRTKGTEFERSI